MSGVNPYAYLQQVSVELSSITRADQLKTVLDELEFLYEVISPELQDQADAVMDQVRKKLALLRQAE